MNRTNIYLSDEQRERLHAESERTGLSSSEIIRRAIDHWFDQRGDHIELPVDEEVEGLIDDPYEVQIIKRLERLEKAIWRVVPEEEMDEMDKAAVKFGQRMKDASGEGRAKPVFKKARKGKEGQ
jgi:predicted DNA-binding protein